MAWTIHALSLSIRALLFVFFFATVGQAQSMKDPVVENNLFAPNRSPQGGSQSDTQSSKISSSDIQLDGILLLGGKKQAIFKVNPSVIGEEKASKGSYITISEGGKVGSYRVVSIQKSQVILEQTGEQVVIPLMKPNKQTPPVSIPPPVMPPMVNPPTASPKETKQSLTTPSPGSSPLASESIQTEGEQQPFPSPEAFEKLSPEEKEEWVKRMQDEVGKRIKRIKK
ncbi:MAG: hypothetical protein N2260_05605 [Syntrophobacterales bacterium]|nr:hypothetical protein [Syntrophobacterales bacterium]